ncbi:MAG: LuxR C-terminal-related transcriptional regulator [Chloroflexota bacterium]
MGKHGKLTLISAPAGFGKTTLVAEWIAAIERSVAWLSLDDGDSDPVRFLTYIVAAMQTVEPEIGKDILNVLESPQPPPIDSLLTPLLNQLAMMPEDFILVLDDYHVLDHQEIDVALTFLIDNQPPGMHLIITTREDPRLPLARLRARGQLSEIRAADLRFTTDEASEFLNSVMGLKLSAEDIAALEQRTEGWIAGLQLAAISMRGQQDATTFIQSFTGSHHFVLDYLMEEVLNLQPPHIQWFLLKTSILNRLSAPLCDTLLQDPSNSSSEMLEHIRQANLFLIPLDNERRWFRYHHLFGDLLRQRLDQHHDIDTATLHIRASAWYERQGQDVEAFHHAAAADDIPRAARLMTKGIPFYFRGVLNPVLDWLESLPETVLNAEPSLLVAYAAAKALSGQDIDIANTKLAKADAMLQLTEPNVINRDLIGQIAVIHAMLAIPQYDIETMTSQAERSLQYLSPENLTLITFANWVLGLVYQFQGNRTAATTALRKTLTAGETAGNIVIKIAAFTSLGQLALGDNNLNEAEHHFQQVAELAGNPPWVVAAEAYLGLARVAYQRNDLETATKFGQLSEDLGIPVENVDTPIAGMTLLAQIHVVQGALDAAKAKLNDADALAKRRGFLHILPNVVEVKISILIRQSEFTEAMALADEYDLPISKARVYLAQGDPTRALTVLEAYRAEMETRQWHDETLRSVILMALAYEANGEAEASIKCLATALIESKSTGIIRLYMDEGEPMAKLLELAAKRGLETAYVNQLLVAFDATLSTSPLLPAQTALIEPLSDRELEVLRLIADGLTNQEVAQRLYLSLHTVKVHARNIYGKLNVKNRTQAVTRGRQLGILPDA